MSPAAKPCPAFIVGCPRSGTSVFFKTLSKHPAFATTTNLTRRFFPHFWIVKIAEMFHAKQRPVEARALWETFWPSGDHVSVPEDCSESDRRTLRRIVAGHTRHFGRPVFLAKNPSLTMRIRWLAEGLPDAKFIHLVRDGRATAASIHKICRRKNKRWSIKKAWPELYDADYATFSGMLWSHLAVAGDESLRHVDPANVLHVRYEEFVQDPRDMFRRAAELCGVTWEPEHDALLPEIRNHNGAWDDEIDAEDRHRMYEQVLPGLRHFGYDVDSEFSVGSAGSEAERTSAAADRAG